MEPRTTRIEKHRQQIAHLATIPFMVALLGFAMLYFCPSVPNWVDLILMTLGLLTGATFMALSHRRLALAPILYEHKKYPEQGYFVVVCFATAWARNHGNGLYWRRVRRLMPGVYLLLGTEFQAPQNDFRRITEATNIEPNEPD